MLVRIDPRTKYISLLSLPRDLHVNIPGYGVDKINAAYTDGGYKLALKTVESVTGVDVNYLVTVDFRGFRDLVDSFHGVYVPVDQHYYHSNTSGSDQYSEIDIQPGYQKLNGTDAWPLRATATPTPTSTETPVSRCSCRPSRRGHPRSCTASASTSSPPSSDVAETIATACR